MAFYLSDILFMFLYFCTPNDIFVFKIDVSITYISYIYVPYLMNSEDVNLERVFLGQAGQ